MEAREAALCPLSFICATFFFSCSSSLRCCHHQHDGRTASHMGIYCQSKTTFSWRKTLFLFANVISLISKHHRQLKLFISFSVQLYRHFSRFLFFLCFKWKVFYYRLFTVLIHFLRINKTKANKCTERKRWLHAYFRAESLVAAACRVHVGVRRTGCVKRM